MNEEIETLYDVLGLDDDASGDQIREAYRALAQKWHPDKHPDNIAEATRQFQRINEAYQTLSDETKRARYDDTGRIELEEKGDEKTEAAIQILTQFFMDAVNTDAARCERSDVKMMCHAFVSQRQGERRAAIKALEDRIRVRQRLLKRWTRKSGKPNFLRNALKRDIRGMKDQIKVNEASIEIANVALELIEEFDWAFDRPETVQERDRRLGGPTAPLIKLLSDWPR